MLKVNWSYRFTSSSFETMQANWDKLFCNNDLPGSRQGFCGSVDGIIGVEGEISCTIGLDEKVKLSSPIILNGHGRQGHFDVVRCCFHRSKPRQLSFNVIVSQLVRQKDIGIVNLPYIAAYLQQLLQVHQPWLHGKQPSRQP